MNRTANNLNAQQRKQVDTMQEQLCLVNQQAFVTNILKTCNWDLNQAINHYYDKNLESNLPNSAFKSQCDMKKAQALFNNYQEGGVGGDMEEEGIGKFFNDIGIDSDNDIVTNLVSMHMGACKMGTYTKEEFLKGCAVLGCDSLATWKAKMPNLQKELASNDVVFQRVYHFVFKFAAAQEGFNNLKMEDAVCLWEFFLAQKVPYLKKWLQFLAEKKQDTKTIQQDQWDMFYELFRQTGGDLTKYVDDGAWPGIIDEFMEYEQN